MISNFINQKKKINNNIFIEKKKKIVIFKISKIKNKQKILFKNKYFYKKIIYLIPLNILEV